MRKGLILLLWSPLAAFGQVNCGAPTPEDIEGPFLPPPYSGRPRHIHVKLQPPQGKALTTQLYFAGESRGADRALVLKLERGEGGLRASYDFVLF